MLTTFALIGCGRIAERHAEQIIKTSTIVAVCDIVKERADSFASKYNCNAYYTLEDLLAQEKPAVASICTPNGLHSKHSIQCLEKDINVLCEKPLCINTDDGEAMIQAAKKSGKKLFVVKQNRYNPPVLAVKKLLEENSLGKIFSFQINCFWNRPADYYLNTWRGTMDLDGGTLFTQFSHFIDLLYWMFGDVRKIKTLTRNFAHPAISFEDTGMVIFEMEEGMIGTLNYTVNSYAENMEGSFTIFGEKGIIKIGGKYLNELEYQNIENMEIKNLALSNNANNYGTYKGSMSNHDKVYENLFKALNTDAYDLANAEEGLKTVEIIERIYESAKLN